MTWFSSNAFSAGDKSAFDLLVRKYQHKVVKLVLRYVRNPAEAEDMRRKHSSRLIGLCLSFVATAPSTRGCTASLSTPPRTVSHREIARRLPTISISPTLRNRTSVQTKLQDPDTPEGMALTEEIRQIVNSAIEALPEELKTAIVLREPTGLSYEEIAAAIECPVGTVRSRIFRAREAIRQAPREVFRGGLGRTEEMV